MLLLILFQATAPQPDIQLHATVDVQSVRIEKKGDASLGVRANPDGGSWVKVQAPKASGAKTLRNVRVTVDAEARIGTGASGAIGQIPTQATDTPEPR